MQTTADNAAGRRAADGMTVSVLTGCADKPYALGLTAALMGERVGMDLVGGDELDTPLVQGSPLVNFLNLRGDQSARASFATKASRILWYYWRLIAYAATARPKVFHILWNNKFQTFDRTALMLYYRALGKKIVLTLHNVNAGERDSNDNALNRLTLRIQYHLAHHIFVHTQRMKAELKAQFGVKDSAISVIPFGVNDTVPNTALTPPAARARLGFGPREKAILFFGHIAPYKGLEYLVDALPMLSRQAEYRLVIAGRPNGFEKYWDDIRRRIEARASECRITQRIEFVPDEETELYFKACDALVLPYRHIFQSGVLFLAYNFGLPVIAADVGSMREDVVEGRTGFMFRPEDSADLAKAIETYFNSDLFRDLPARRRDIRRHAHERHSWATVAKMTRAVYAELLGESLEAARASLPV